MNCYNRKTVVIILVAVTMLAMTFRLGVAWAQTQAEMNNQSLADYKKADAKLNAVYKQLMSTTSGQQKAKIVAAEQIWIKYRDANCEAEAFVNNGGSIYPMIWNGVATRMTLARTAELQGFLSDQQSK